MGTGAAGRIRTPDPCITNALLYRLSYCGPILRRTILKVRCVVKAPMAGRGLYPYPRLTGGGTGGSRRWVHVGIFLRL